MHSTIATEYIARRMTELGHRSGYRMRLRHLILKPQEIRTLSAADQLYILVEPPTDVRIESSSGVFDMSEQIANELQYEHRGDLKITNYSIFINHVRFIQVIPKFCKTPCP